MKIYFLFVCLSILAFALPGQEETYPIKWRFEENLAIAHLQTNESVTCTSQLKKDMEKIYKQGKETTVKLQFLSQWQVEAIENGEIAKVMLLFRNGSIDYRGTSRFYYEVENPKYIKKKDKYAADYPMFPTYLDQVSGGIRFKADFKNFRLIESSRLKLLKDGALEYEEEVLTGDPLNIADSLRELPGKEVPIGHTWTNPRRHGMLLYTYNYKFAGIEKYNGNAKVKHKDKTVNYKGKKLVHIEITGDITKGNEKAGTIEGHYYYDWERRVMVEQDVTHKIRIITPIEDPDNPQVGGKLQEETRRVNRILIATTIEDKEK